ncbi:uncharacterized protein LOC112541560 isoform X2 [Python bivittatus]|uniref:Uncharacterized protein LOC112541560 isoform X2 n=1 Tax=Python bivittatus TaxID=176946 RepID=A0A9F5IUX7_PYTBI|nr:uncharacterized protein LOC112541560 isoform X2 [Python bivittatus]
MAAVDPFPNTAKETQEPTVDTKGFLPSGEAVPWSKMMCPNFRILSAQGFLLCTVLFFGNWDPCAVAEPDSISGAPVFPNNSMNRTGMIPFACQSFQCSGERCYQDEAHGNNTLPCHNASRCELYRLNSTSYTARCSSDCGWANATEMCIGNGGLSLELCIVECCNSPNCLQLNATAYGDRAPTTTPVPTTMTTTTAPPRNGKVCSSFTCHGEGCFKGQKSSTSCIVGYNFCEMKKTGRHFVAGCSKVCKTTGPACTTGSAAPCYQECCQAMPKTSCLKLDGKVHFNGTRGLASAALLQLLAWAALLSLSCNLSFSAGPN